jgi:hypothetical protein
MSAALIIPTFGENLTRGDYAKLKDRWITPKVADIAGIRRVDSLTGREMFSRKRGDLAGLIIPNILPGESFVREDRERLETPDLGVSAEALQATALPLIVTEGKFKALALYRLATYKSNTPRFLPVALSGVWNFRGVVGKATGKNGERRDVKGVISDLDRIAWKGRRVVIAYDADAGKNPQVSTARWRLSSTLIENGAVVGFLEWPIEEGKGIDDRLDAVGPERVLPDIAAIEFGDWRTKLLRSDAGKLIACHENVALFLERSPEWAGVLAFNEFTSRCVVLKPPPPPVSGGWTRNRGPI